MSDETPRATDTQATVSIPASAFARARGRRKRTGDTVAICVRIGDGLASEARMQVMLGGGSMSALVEDALTSHLARVRGVVGHA
jgi:hypothetical protein